MLAFLFIHLPNIGCKKESVLPNQEVITAESGIQTSSNCGWTVVAGKKNSPVKVKDHKTSVFSNPANNNPYDRKHLASNFDRGIPVFTHATHRPGIIQRSPVKNTKLLKDLKAHRPRGEGHKIYERGIDVNGKKREYHYFKNSHTHDIFDLKDVTDRPKYEYDDRF